MMKYILYLLCFFLPTIAAAQAWEQVYPGYSVDDLCAFVHWNGDTVFAAGDNWTLLRSTDAGLTWKNVFTKNK
ncbi:MAG: hypothetical protein GXO82_05310, partial [Chlorobi bacterium]|nr:hypothetical protein [Chlorobiota bacterium]